MAGALYLLDTNMLIYASKGMFGIREKFYEKGYDSLAIPALVAAELAYGVEKSTRQAHNRQLLDGLLSQFRVLPWPQAAIWHFARQFHALKTAGTPIGNMDLLIASQALAEEAILVTNNTREFERVEGLKLENWAQ